MFSRQINRYFTIVSSSWNSLKKSDLAKLRKKTGYTFANCKKALEANNNDLSLAEKWLNEQAQSLGWTKAMKLEGRSTLQGLIGVAQKDSAAVMIEVNCETDFVARNKKFQSLVDLTSQTCLNHVTNKKALSDMLKYSFGSPDLKELVAEDGKTLGDHCALTISSVGENLNLRRAVFLKSKGGIQVAGFTHPSPPLPTSQTLAGKYGAIIAYKSSSRDDQVLQTARQLCQHIVGMNPSKVGVIGIDEPMENKDEENVMLHQEFLLDPSMTVNQLVSDVGIEVVHFVRFECGEQLPIEEDSVRLKATSHV